MDERPLPLSGATNINDCDSVAKAKQWITYQRCEPGPSTMNRTRIPEPKPHSAYAQNAVSYAEAGKLTITISLVLCACVVSHVESGVFVDKQDALLGIRNPVRAGRPSTVKSMCALLVENFNSLDSSLGSWMCSTRAISWYCLYPCTHPRKRLG